VGQKVGGSKGRWVKRSVGQKVIVSKNAENFLSDFTIFTKNFFFLVLKYSETSRSGKKKFDFFSILKSEDSSDSYAIMNSMEN
jgi:hypothetical protein